jgi:cysteinyl-tRNA synthetase
MYSCGPTVYNLIHIGNLRGGVVADLFFRYFKRVGYDVCFVRNYTDVDDKIINRAKEVGMTPEALALKYIGEVERDYAVSGMIEPTHKTTVTGHIAEIIETIEQIIQAGKAYVIDGEVLFSIQDFKDYGRLSGKKIEDLIAGIRVEVNSKKRNALDFSLWKPAKPGEPYWESPWGKGRPGWHIECSAMAMKWLGPQMDIHHGGEDLIFPHHENEIAQSEAASHKAPFVSIWMHHAFVTLSKEKMSKSLGNTFLARDFLTRYSGEIARTLLLGAHYRSPIDFGQEAVDQTLALLQRLYEAKQKAAALLKISRAVPDLRAETAWGSFVASCEQAKKEIDAAYANDFNTPEALAALFTLIREFNRVSAEPLAQATPSATLGAQALMDVVEDDIGSVLGIGRLSPEKALADIDRVKRERLSAEGSSRPSDAEIQGLIDERIAARKAKDFKRSDELRAQLDALGVVIKDNPTGTSWNFK